jgi:hypothetical protein
LRGTESVQIKHLRKIFSFSDHPFIFSLSDHPFVVLFTEGVTCNFYIFVSSKSCSQREECYGYWILSLLSLSLSTIGLGMPSEDRDIIPMELIGGVDGGVDDGLFPEVSNKD